MVGSNTSPCQRPYSRNGSVRVFRLLSQHFAAQPTSTRRVRVSSAACLCLAPTANKPSLSIQLPRADQVAVSCPLRPRPRPPTPPTSGLLCISFSPSVSCTLPLFPALTPDHCSTVLLLANKAGLLHLLSKSIHYSTHPRAGMTSEEAATGAARVYEWWILAGRGTLPLFIIFIFL
jgi:hypothetical protein